MKKGILIIPDVHGRDFWKEAVESQDYEKVVFLGDYSDPYDIEGITDDVAIANFKSIIDYKQQNPDKVVLLLGNHDLHYYSEFYYELAGGVRYDPIAAISLQRLFQENPQLFQLAYETDWGGKRYLFSHAGITQCWLKRNIDLIRKPDARHLNRLIHSNEGLEALAQVGEMRWGDYPSGSMVCLYRILYQTHIRLLGTQFNMTVRLSLTSSPVSTVGLHLFSTIRERLSL